MVECIKTLGENILASYIFIVLIKVFAYYSFRKFCGIYVHNNGELQNITFMVSIANKPMYFINPIQRMIIHIKRSGDNMDWDAFLHSDIINLTHFRGPYIIKYPDGGKNGWFDAYLSSKPNIQIALYLHFLNNHQWKEGQGYIIVKQ